MSRKTIKSLVIRTQYALAERDFYQGLPPQKRSKTYMEAYGRMYELSEKRSNQNEWVTI